MYRGITVDFAKAAGVLPLDSSSIFNRLGLLHVLASIMATVNKQSLREAFDALKGEFERLCASGKMAADSRALFQAMLMLIDKQIREPQAKDRRKGPRKQTKVQTEIGKTQRKQNSQTILVSSVVSYDWNHSIS